MLSPRLLFAVFVLAASSAVAASNPIDVTITQLIASPQEFNGKRVAVTGYFDTTEHHGCDLRATKQRSDDGRQYIHVDVTEPMERPLKTLTRGYTRLLRVRVVGLFQYRYTGEVARKPVYGDPNISAIVTMQTGFGWMGLWDKQITKITSFRVLATRRI